MKIWSARRVVLIVAVLSAAVLLLQPLLRREAQAHAKKPVDNRTSPAGRLLFDATTGLPAVTPLTMNFARSPGTDGPDGKGRYLIAINSGYGLLFNSKSKAQQTLSVIDLNRKPEPQVIQNIYFPAPQSANVGITFDWRVLPDGKYRFYVSGGYENKIWIFGLDPKAAVPVVPANRPDETVKADSIDVSALSTWAPSPNYNGDVAAVYPTGLGLSRDGETIFIANNLGDTLGVISDLRNSRWIDRVSLKRPGSKQFVYPYDVAVMNDGEKAAKVFISLWGDDSVAVVNKTGSMQYQVSHIPVGRHPTAMKINRSGTRLYVANSNEDTVSVIDTTSEKVIETIGVRVNEAMPIGASPEGLALDEDHKTLYVADAHANAVAVVSLAEVPSAQIRSKLVGLIPTGRYASAVAVIAGKLFIANGKGTGMDNSSVYVNDTGFYPNIPNSSFPGDSYNKRGNYSAAEVSGNISVVDVPDEKQLYEYTQTVLRQNGLIGQQKRSIFAGGKSPFKHVIYIIRENRTYDQVFGDLAQSGDGTKADGDDWLAIFGAGIGRCNSRRRATEHNAECPRSLALRFGLLDRFFVNAEASPDGHNWSTAAFSNDYVDKAFRWNYSRRGRTYDFEGFNRLPSYNPPSGQPPVQLPPVFDLPATGEDVAGFLKRYVPYLNGARDIAEPQTLYLWDAAARAGKTYRNYGEFIATVSEADVKELNTRKGKKYPDISPTQTAFATKKSLEGHFSTTARNFDLDTPDIMSTDSYKAVRQAGAGDPAITPDAADLAHRGMTRFGAWQQEFRAYVDDLKAGKGDRMPNLSIVRLSNDHTSGLRRNIPTPQFYVAENDYALGRLVQEVSNSPYWADTAIFVVEDDAQDGPDHVDAHRSPAFVISAYNRPGALVHEFHNTVSLIRTLELCLGLEPMNFLDTNATPIDIFTAKADLRPYEAQMPIVSLNNLFPPDRADAAMAYFMDRSAAQDLTHPDMADPRELNEIIWYSVKRKSPMPGIARMPAYDLFRTGMKDDDDRRENRSADDDE